MSLDRTKELIEKYFNGETSLEEEKQLQSFFQREDIPIEFKEYQLQFKDIQNRQNIRWEDFSEDKLFGKLEENLDQEEQDVKVVSINRSTLTWIYRIAAAVALILVGYLAGNNLKSDDGLDEVRKELQQMKAMMFDNLGSNSASGRLQAVNNSFDIDAPDDEILDALIQRMYDDKNTNVRLKAIESLARFGDNIKVKNSLVDALGSIEEPAIQISLIHVLVELKEKSAIENLEKITEGSDVLKEVKAEAHLGIFKLKDL